MLVNKLSSRQWPARQFYNWFMSMDGAECPILEPSAFTSQWFSHKLNGPGLRNDVPVSIDGGHICLVNGPFKCGSFADVTILDAF